MPFINWTLETITMLAEEADVSTYDAEDALDAAQHIHPHISEDDEDFEDLDGGGFITLYEEALRILKEKKR